MKPVWKYGLAVALILLLIPLAFAGAQEGDGDPEAGGDLYVENCAVCHGVAGQGRVGANLQNFPGIDVEAALTQIIRDGIDGSVMPAWLDSNGGPLTEAQIADIVAYIRSAFGGTEPIEPLPEYDPPEMEPLPDVEGDPAQGAVVYQENCAMCHGAEGIGYFGAPLAKNWPGPEPAAFIQSVVRSGIPGTMMPAWGAEEGGPLTGEQIKDVSAYVLSLSPAMQELATPQTQEGPLGLGTSLLILAALVAIVVVIIAIYYRRA